MRLLSAAMACSLVAAVLTSQAPAAVKLDPRASSAAAALSVRLQVSTHHAVQFHGVLFRAQPSSNSVTTYVFDYGDGITESTYQPLAMHGYRTPGTYHARVTVTDPTGRLATSAQVTIHVRDGIPPVVRIDNPRPNQRLRLGPTGILFTGSAHDSDGVARVQLAIQLISPLPHVKTGGNCIWYGAQQSLVLTACSTPYFFNARFRGGRWTFRLGPTVTIPAGSYVIRVRAVDRAGNISSYYAVRLGTILPFKLTP